MTAAKTLKPAAWASSLVLALMASSSALALDGGFEKTADGVIVTPAGGPAKKVRLQVMSDRIIHVTATPSASLDLPPSLMVVAKPATGGFTVEAVGDKVLVKAAKATAEVSLTDGTVDFRDATGKLVLAERDRGAFIPVKIDGKDFFEVRQQFNPGTDEAFYGLGQHQNGQMNYNGEDVQLLQYNRAVAVPMLLSSKRYGLLWDNNSITRFGDPKPYGVVSRDLKVFGADGKPGGFTAKYHVDGKLVATRTEADIDYRFLKDLPNWPAAAYDAEKKAPLPKQTVTWEGSIEADKAGVHKFQLYSSDYAKLYIDGKLVIDRWRQNWNPWYHNFEAALTPGKRHKVRLEWIPNGGFIGLLHNNPMPAADRHSLQMTSEVGLAIDYYFIGGDDLDQVVSGYRKLTGTAVMMPRWAYGYWQSRQRYENQKDLVAVVKEYRDRKLPIDNIVLDWRYWKDPTWGSHKFDETRFPDPQGMLDDVHKMNAHFMISIWPKFYPTTDHYKELDAKGYIYRRQVELGIKDWIGFVNTDYDPYTEEARAIYWRQVKDSLKGFGIDAWWMDATEPDLDSNVDLVERTKRISPTALGPAEQYFNTFALVHTGGVYKGERELNPDVRPFILTRSGFAGLQRNASAVWSGDIVARWDDLKDQISAGVNLSMSGIPNWTTDIGGFSVEDRYTNKDPAHWAEWQELNLRWFQFGAFSPLFRSHGETPFREIYNLADTGTEVYKALAWYDELRYRLMPYTYTLAAETYHRDGLIMRGMVMDFPDDLKARGVNDQYLFGRAFLVAPVTTFKARSRPVYLPAGTRWYDFNTGKAFQGGQTITAEAPLARMPLYVRAGSIVPTGPVIQYTGEKPDAPITLLVYAGADGKFELYEDDGVSNGYERGAYSRIPISYDDASGKVSIGPRSGSFKGMVDKRVFKVRFIGAGINSTQFDTVDATVDYDGTPVVVKRKG